MKLQEVAAVIRSKNSGPYELTFDIIFKQESVYNRIVSKKIINTKKIALLYHISEEDVISIINFKKALAIKATIIRPIGSGNIGERDVYGAQQHAPLMDIEIDT